MPIKTVNIICIICGKEFSVVARRRNTAKCCSEKCKGEKYRYKLDIGKKFGMLTALKEVESIKHKNINKRMVLWLCDCGEKKVILFSSVRNGNTVSCGCHHYNVLTAQSWAKTHGLKHHPLNNVWNSMKQRCYNKRCKEYRFYGAKGVTICSEWKNDFKNFYDWCISNGWVEGLQIDRYPNKTGNYEPNNCRLVSSLVNCNNRTNSLEISFRGEKTTLSLLCRKLNLQYSLVYRRIKKQGYSLDEVISYIESEKIAANVE